MNLFPRCLIIALAAVSCCAAVDERFGVITHFAQGWDPSLAGSISRANVREVRDELYWNQVEPQPDVFSFPPQFDRYMAVLRRNRESPLIILSFENPNYDGGNTPYTDAGIAAFARYAVEVLRRYPHQIGAVEVWNEYNGTFCKGPATADRAENYLKLLRATYAAVKAAHPEVLVVGGATAGVPLPYWDKLLSGGALQCMDALSVHPYRYDLPPEGVERDIDALRELVSRYGKRKPIWVTEIGWVIRGPRAPGDLSIDATAQAQFLVRACALLLSRDVARTYWYMFRDDPDAVMGLVQNDSAQTPRLAYTAMANLIRQLYGARFVERESTPLDFYSLRFADRDQKELRILWSLTPRRLTVSGVDKALDMLGNVVASAGTLDVNESPLIVFGPLRGLPTSTETLLTDSQLAFGGTQGGDGWYYGVSSARDGPFSPTPTFTSDDWHYAWVNGYPYLAITAIDQHPSVIDGKPVAAIRRWQSSVDGEIHVTGSFRSQPAGDGVGVRVLVDGQPRIDEQIGGGSPIFTTFDFTETVKRGTVIDFATDPGPATDINSDATVVNVVITKPNP